MIKSQVPYIHTHHLLVWFQALWRYREKHDKEPGAFPVLHGGPVAVWQGSLKGTTRVINGIFCNNTIDSSKCPFWPLLTCCTKQIFRTQVRRQRLTCWRKPVFRRLVSSYLLDKTGFQKASSYLLDKTGFQKASSYLLDKRGFQKASSYLLNKTGFLKACLVVDKPVSLWRNMSVVLL